ncbi:hypothetical protein Glove_109g305 [Diversispora epigaea]|uniref:Protein kinase domain-containing protein n=1 Tax=Diversispora epigaea TaxID=1348612 RepID=A0A397J725_9GLOM|nr:hypothetical protein Glove_109g305 [Diversispora epigaea]
MGLENIHEIDLMHKDFHPVSETLNRGEYTQASDIYSFGMVILEVLTSYQPYYNIPYNKNFAMGIWEGLNLKFNLLNRPTAKELGSQRF